MQSFVICLKVWSTLLSAKIEDEDCQPLWENGVRETLKKRIDRVIILLDFNIL